MQRQLVSGYTLHVKRKNDRVYDFVNQNFIALILALLGFILIGAGFAASKLSLFSRKEPIVISQETSAKIRVDIQGAVNKPGLIILKDSSRVSDLINAAGGLAENADKSWVAKNINLAQVLTDGAKIYIPTILELEKTSSSNLQVLGNTDLININNASESELDSLPGIGKVTAQKIISGRPYQTIKELKTRKIVGNSTFEKIKNLISVF